MSLVKDDEIIKLFTILERQRTTREREDLHSYLRRGSKLRGDEIRPKAKLFNVV